MSDAETLWPELPTETEIYILPNGEIVVADLPAELAAQLAQFMSSSDSLNSHPAEVDHVADQ